MRLVDLASLKPNLGRCQRRWSGPDSQGVLGAPGRRASERMRNMLRLGMTIRLKPGSANAYKQYFKDDVPDPACGRDVCKGNPIYEPLFDGSPRLHQACPGRVFSSVDAHSRNGIQLRR